MAWSEKQLDDVFNKGTVYGTGNAKKGYRKDACGAWIKRSLHGKTTKNGFGWQVDHIQHDSKGGSDDLSNLRPLQWENNQARGDGRLKCVVKSKGDKNVAC